MFEEAPRPGSYLVPLLGSAAEQQEPVGRFGSEDQRVVECAALNSSMEAQQCGNAATTLQPAARSKKRVVTMQYPLPTAADEDGHQTATRRSDRRRTTLGRLGTIVTESISHSIERIGKPNYGQKTIGQLGSMVYLTNQIFGAGIVALPFILKVSGWLPSLAANLFVCLVSIFATLMMLRCMTMIPGRRKKRMDFRGIVLLAMDCV